MSNACFKALTAPQLGSRCFRSTTTSRSSTGRDAFFARFYTLVTGPGPARPDLSSSSQKCPQQRCLPRRIHDSPSLLAKRAAPRSRPQPVSRKPKSLRSLTFENVSKHDLDQIFKTEVDLAAGRQALKTLHARRVSGSLLEYGIQIEDVDIPTENLEYGLSWLRDRYPVDEQLAADDWAVKEALKLQDHYILRAQRLGILKKTPVQSRDDAVRQAESPSSYSAIDGLRKYLKDETAKKDRAYEQSPQFAQDQELRLAKIEEKKNKEEERQKALAIRREKQELAGMVSHNETAPEMSNLQRLGPSTIFALILTGGFCLYAANYQPPTFDQRIMQDLTPSWATVVTIASSCTLICFLWRVPRLWRTFNKYLVAVPADPYVLSILGNVFSHTTYTHLGVNMLFVFAFGLPLHEMVGRGNFIALYCLGGMFGSITSMYWFVLRGVLTTYSTGASGAVAAIAFAWAVLNIGRDSSHDDDNRFYWDTGRYCMLFFQVIAHLSRNLSGHIDVASHIGGAALGIIGALLLKWRHRRSVESEAAPPQAIPS